MKNPWIFLVKGSRRVLLNNTVSPNDCNTIVVYRKKSVYIDKGKTHNT